VKPGQFLPPVQRHIRGVDVEHELGGRAPVSGDELLDQHPVQRHGLGARGPRFQPAQRRRGGQGVDATHRCLQQQVRTQRVVIVQVLVAATQPVDALRQQVAQPMPDAGRIARVAEHRCHRAGQPNAFIGPAQQHQAAVGTQVATVKVRFNNAAPDSPEIDLLRGTIRHPQSSVVSRL